MWDALNHEIGRRPRQLFDVTQHLPEGADEPGRDDAKARIGLFIDAAGFGRSGRYTELRQLLRASHRLAEAVKHDSRPSRHHAGMAADATVLLVSLLRRVDELQDRDAINVDLT